MAQSASTATTDHEEIRRWAEEHGGRPARVRATEGEGDGAGGRRGPPPQRADVRR